MKWLHIIAIILILAAYLPAQQPVAALPAGITGSLGGPYSGTTLDTTYSLPVGGTNCVAHTAAAFTGCLNSTVPGDIITLDAGTTYAGNFTAPAKANPNHKWIYIVSSAYASLPAPGTRVGPADAANMPKIQSLNTVPTITLPSGAASAANYWRLVGLEVTTASTQGGTGSQAPYTSRLVDLSMTLGNVAPDHIIVDRCYIHASNTIDARTGVTANGTNVAIIDSYISDIHQDNNDSQAIICYYGAGPHKWNNNFLQAGGENVMTGGAGGLSNNIICSDIEMQNNYFFLPMSWDAVGITLPPGNKWIVKNLLEFKSAQRVLVNNNVFENVWPSAQTGFATNIKVVTTQSGNVAVTDDLTYTNNVFKNVSSGVNHSSTDTSCATTPGCTSAGEVKRIVLYNNLFLLGDTTQPGYGSGYSWGMNVFDGATDLVFQHNTVVGPPNLGYCPASIYFEQSSSPPLTYYTHNVWVNGNALCRQLRGNTYGFMGQTPTSLTAYMGDPPATFTTRLTGDAFYLPAGQGESNYQSSLPATNLVTGTAFTYTNPPTDYTLLTPSLIGPDGLQAGILSGGGPPPTGTGVVIKGNVALSGNVVVK